MNMEERVILVNEQDQEVGLEEKMAAHRKGLLHRAFSIFIFNSNEEMLLQQRAQTKYHSGGLWTNTCCSHPRKGETTAEAAHRRLQEEFGFDCSLQEQFSFIYQADLDQGLQEHEFDHVFTGYYNGSIDHVNPQEIATFRWITLDNLRKEMQAKPELFTVWFRIILDKYVLTQ
ncbi:MAG: isopentenyl-diphosphate delta-isomerase [Chlamydiia bacterium]|nr:isopentenyl-diphosphate delta-isomerase [Chlamydiia bacterium]